MGLMCPSGLERRTFSIALSARECVFGCPRGKHSCMLSYHGLGCKLDHGLLLSIATIPGLAEYPETRHIARKTGPGIVFLARNFLSQSVNIIRQALANRAVLFRPSLVIELQQSVFHNNIV